MSLKSRLIRNVSNLPGWRTSRRIIVIESDDWGSIRMPSKKAYDELKQKGIDLDSGDSYRYNQNDTLASHDDLAGLFEVLSKYKDKNGHHPVFTAVSLVANPDFEKIKTADFNQYHYEPFTESLKRYGRENAFDLWQEGIKTHLFVPQFHGREHLNIAAWMRALKKGDRDSLLAFDQRMWGFNNKKPAGLSYQAAFDLEYAEDLKIQEEVITSGLALFEDIHKFKAEYFVPPNGPFNNSLEKIAAQRGIAFMMASKIQHEALGNGRTKKVFHWLGQKNKLGQRYITRNCFFEPSDHSKDWIDSCMSDISIAFKWNKPAIISSHRVNFIGSLNPTNRSHGLGQLEKLIDQIIRKWPDVEFMTSAELGKLISRS